MNWCSYSFRCKLNTGKKLAHLDNILKKIYIIKFNIFIEMNQIKNELPCYSFNK